MEDSIMADAGLFDSPGGEGLSIEKELDEK